MPAVQAASFFATSSPATDPFVVGPSITSASSTRLADLLMEELVDRVIVGATEAAGKKKSIGKTACSSLASLTKPLYKILADAAEGLIEGACEYKALLSKQFANNWNWGYL